ncbi:MAG: hypothetical protein ABW292_10695, partial [Vicinamibacterales bacterium]
AYGAPLHLPDSHFNCGAGALRFAVEEAAVFLPSAKNAMALFVGICAAGLILEVGLRMTGRFRSQGIHTVSEQDYGRIPGPWEPNQDYVDNTNTALPIPIPLPGAIP